MGAFIQERRNVLWRNVFLVIEDDEQIVELYRLLLEPEDYYLAISHRPYAIQEIITLRPRLIILDIFDRRRERNGTIRFYQGNIFVHFSGPWEVPQLEILAEQGIAWVRFSRVGGGPPIVGKIESQTHEVRLYEGWRSTGKEGGEGTCGKTIPMIEPLLIDERGRRHICSGL